MSSGSHQRITFACRSASTHSSNQGGYEGFQLRDSAQNRENQPCMSGEAHFARADEPLVRRDIAVFDLRHVGRIVACYRSQLRLRHGRPLPGLTHLRTGKTTDEEIWAFPLQVFNSRYRPGAPKCKGFLTARRPGIRTTARRRGSRDTSHGR
jgi:hypothetical protein